MTLLKQWKEAASLIFLSRSFVKSNISNGCNFKVLLLKRNDKSSFMPGKYVFPGGVVEAADSSEKWLSLFKKFGFDQEQLTLSENNNSPMFRENVTKDLMTVPKTVSLRISAIRETFEECGILICKRDHHKSKWVSFLAGHEIQKWQSAVRNDPNKFFDLCMTFNCLPDIWALHLRSNWLTPKHLKKRFDTAFFIVTCDQIPPVFIDNKEIVEFRWHTPYELKTLCATGDITLAPPQYYELARLQQIKEIEHLHNSSLCYNTSGCKQWMPVQIKTSNGLAFLLPGDYMYEAYLHNDSGDIAKFEGNMESFRSNNEPLHRMEIRNPSDLKIIVQNLSSSMLSDIDACMPFTEEK